MYFFGRPLLRHICDGVTILFSEYLHQNYSNHDVVPDFYNCGFQPEIYMVTHNINPHSAGFDFKTSDSDVKVDPRTVKIKIFVMAVDPLHRYSNESEKADFIQKYFNTLKFIV